jgi:hypothetical protein
MPLFIFQLFGKTLKLKICLIFFIYPLLSKSEIMRFTISGLSFCMRGVLLIRLYFDTVYFENLNRDILRVRGL